MGTAKRTTAEPTTAEPTTVELAPIGLAPPGPLPATPEGTGLRGTLLQSGRRSARLPDRVEWPTVWVAIGVYGPIGIAIWAVATGSVPWWVVTPILIWSVAWQTSLQHEVVHGHPTPWPWANRLIAGPPLLLWVPFDRYRDCHLAHHIDERLTDPLDDPESWYVTAEAWERTPAPIRWLRIVMNTFLGRIVLGPLWLMGRALAAEAGDAIHGRRLAAVVGHAALIVIILAVLHRTGFPVWAYGLMVVWPASALLAIRSFAEHRPHDDPAARSLIVENGGLLALLFLGNNLHAVHHARPGLPWYLLKGVFMDSRIDVLRRNQDYRFVSYASIIVRYLIVPRDHPIHPRDRG